MAIRSRGLDAVDPHNRLSRCWKRDRDEEFVVRPVPLVPARREAELLAQWRIWSESPVSPGDSLVWDWQALEGNTLPGYTRATDPSGGQLGGCDEGLLR